MSTLPFHEQVRRALYSRLGIYVILFLFLLISVLLVGAQNKESEQNVVDVNSISDKGISSKYVDDKKQDIIQDEKNIIGESEIEAINMNMRVHFLDVKHGDSALVQFPNKANLLIDGGFVDQKVKLYRYLNDNDVSILDAILVSHPDEDHLGGLANILYKMNFVSEVYDNGQEQDNDNYNSYSLAVKKKAMNIVVNESISFVMDNSISTELMFAYDPYNSEYLPGTNDNSILLRIVNDNVSFLFTGDCEVTCQEIILEKYDDISADVLKFPHHGDIDALSTKFLDAVNPSYVVISTGQKDEFGHPDDEVILELESRNLTLLRTDINETIIFDTDGNSINVSIYSIKSTGLLR